MRYARAAGWAAFAAAPILLSALAVAAARPHAPASLVTNAAWAAWIAGALAFVASMLAARGASAPARLVAGLCVLVVVGFSLFLVELSRRTAPMSGSGPPSDTTVQRVTPIAPSGLPRARRVFTNLYVTPSPPKLRARRPGACAGLASPSLHSLSSRRPPSQAGRTLSSSAAHPRPSEGRTTAARAAGSPTMTTPTIPATTAG